MLALYVSQIITLIYERANSLVYRGIREADGQVVLLKVLQQEYPTINLQ